MSDSFFQDLLDAGLLLDLGDAPDRLDFLKGAAKDIAQTLQTAGGRASTLPLTLVGLDPDAPEDDPTFKIIADVVAAYWPTYRNAFRDGTPRQVLRVVALEAVRQAAHADSQTASAAWYTAASALPHADLGQARSTIERMFLEVGQSVEQAAAAVWGHGGSGGGFRMPSRSTASGASVTAPVVAAAALTGTFQTALNKNIALMDVTGSYTNHQAQPWATAFAPDLASAVAAAINHGLTALTSTINEAGLLSTEGIKAFAEETGNNVRAAVAEASVASAGQELRTKLLWWHQTLYSPALGKNYRDVDAPRAALAIAVDAYRLVPTPSPQAVEHLVRETVRVIAADAGSMTGVEFAALARSHHDVWESAYELGRGSTEARAPLLMAALHDGDRAQMLGRLADAEASLADYAAHAFRDLHAARSAATDA